MIPSREVCAAFNPLAAGRAINAGEDAVKNDIFIPPVRLLRSRRAQLLKSVVKRDPMTKHRCEDCQFFQDPNTCRINPPVVIAAGETVHHRMWPVVTPDDWCGRFVGKSDRDASSNE